MNIPRNRSLYHTIRRLLKIAVLSSFPIALLADVDRQQDLVLKLSTEERTNEIQSLSAELVDLASESMQFALSKKPSSPKHQSQMVTEANQALKSRVALFGENSLEVIATEYDLAQIYQSIGRISPAKKIVDSALEKVAAHFPDNPLHGLIILRRLSLYSDLSIENAKPLFELAEQIFTREFGSNSFEMTRLHLLRGQQMLNYGDLEKANLLFQKSIDSQTTVSPKDDFLLARATANQNRSVYGQLENFDENFLMRLSDVEFFFGVLAIENCSKMSGYDIFNKETTLPIRATKSQTCVGGLKSLKLEEMLVSIGYLLMSGDIDEAGKLTKQYNELLDQQGPTEADVSMLIAKGNYKRAIKLTKLAGGFLIKENGANHPRVADYLTLLARLYRWVGEGEQAAVSERLALGIMLKQAPTETGAIVNLLIKLGIHRAYNGEFELARQYFDSSEKLLGLINQNGALHEMSEQSSMSMSAQASTFSRTDRAYLIFLMGDFRKAEKIFKDSLKENTLNKGESHAQTIISQFELADFYGDLNYDTRASEIMNKSFVVFEKMQPYAQKLAAAQIVLARHFYYEKKYSEAQHVLEGVLDQSAEHFEPTHVSFANYYTELANIHIAADQAELALPYLRKLSAHPVIAGNPQKFATTQVKIASVLLSLDDKNQMPEAISLLEDALLQLNIFGSEFSLWNAEATMSEAMLRNGNVDAAIYFGKLAVNHLQYIRSGLSQFSQPLQNAFLGDKEHAYRILTDALVEAGDLLQAQLVIGMLKDHEYDNFLTRRSGTPTKELSMLSLSETEESTGERYQALATDLLQIHRELQVLNRQKSIGQLASKDTARLKQLKKLVRSSRKEFAKEISTIRQEFASLSQARVIELGERNFDSLGALQGTVKRLGDDVALVQYLVLPDKIRMILTTGSLQTSLVTEIDQSIINSLIFSWREEVDLIGDDVQSLSSELYGHLFAALEPYLEQQGVNTVMISLDGVLRYLPFSALHDGERYLAEKYRFSLFTPAARLSIERRPKEIWQIAAFGVSEATPDFVALPAVPSELDEIVNENLNDLAGALPGIVKLNSQFTNESFSDVLSGDEESLYPVIHIASHFNFIPGKESQSFLLTGSGELSIDELQYGEYSLQDVDLLTLSACNSGLSGIDADGAEIEGFAALAQNKGAASVLATLWPVADKSTGRFMSDFYRQRAVGATSKAAAIQTIQKRFIEDDLYAHPYFWAPFVLMGNWL